MARTAGRRRLAGRAAAQDFGYGRRARLDSRCAGGLGSAMAAPMIPPAHAPAFLAAHGWGDARIMPLAGDGSFRRYIRVVDKGRQAVLYDAPPAPAEQRPLIAVVELPRRGGPNASPITTRHPAQTHARCAREIGR